MTDLGCLGLIRRRFRLFRHDSRPISAIRWPANTTQFGWYGLILTKSAWFGANRSWVSANRAGPAWIQGKKKKKAQTRHWWVGSHIGHCTPHWATSDSSVAPSQPCPCFIGFQMVERNLIKINEPFHYGF